MKRIIIYLLILPALVISCNFDSWEIERETKTLAGSVASPYVYLAYGEVDGKSNEKEEPLFVMINKVSDIAVSLEISSKNIDYSGPAHTIVGGITDINTASFKLSGSAADVKFDSPVTMRITDKDSRYSVTGSVGGWLKNTFLLDKVWTKAQVAEYEYEGSIELAWKDSAGVEHKLIINKITR